MARKLTGIEVEEISLVDAAANRKKFSIIKRKHTMDKLIEILKSIGLELTAEELEKAGAMSEEAQKALKMAVGLLGKYADEMPKDVLAAIQTLARGATTAAAPVAAHKSDGGDEDVTLEKVGARLSKATKAELAKLKAMIGEGFSKAQDILDAMIAGDGADPALQKYEGKPEALIAVIKAGEKAQVDAKAALEKAAKDKDDAIEARFKKLEDENAALKKSRGISKSIKGQDGDKNDEPELDKDGKPIKKVEGPLWPSLGGPEDDAD
jgi:hypothetical protein